MSINALGSVSLYEYYYQINNKKKPKNIETQENMNKQANTKEEIGPFDVDVSGRPWASIMQQLGIPFDSNPKSDIENIKKSLEELLKDFEDDEVLTTEINELKDYIDVLYNNFVDTPQDAKGNASYILSELQNISLMNSVSIY